jgi:hypothetical protein
VVELEAAQVHAGDLHEPNADEPVGEVLDIGVETNNLLVNRGAVDSRLAAEHEEDRLSGPAGLGESLRVVKLPAVPRGIDFLGFRNAGCEQEQREPGD